MNELPEWLSAIAALGALAAAVFAGSSAARVYRLERRRDVEAADLRARAGAVRVNAWAVVRFVDGARQPNGLVLANGDRTPIFDREVHSSDHRGNAKPPLRLHIFPPGEFFVEEDATYHWSFAKILSGTKGSVRPVTKHEQWRVTRLAFTDAAGRHWIRNERGELSAAQKESV